MKARSLVVVACLASVTLLSGASPSITSSVLESHPQGACAFPTYVSGAGWDFCWQQDDIRGQGLELNQVLFQGDPVMWKIGLPFSLTHYEGDQIGPFKDTLGASAFFGENPGYGRGALQIHPEDCPRFLGQGLLLSDRFVCVEFRDGPEPAVAIWARYDIFNYRFLQGYVMDSRGVMEPFVRLGGTLINGPGADGTNHFHHVYWRVDLDVGAEGNDTVEAFLAPQEDLRKFARDDRMPSACQDAFRAATQGFCSVTDEGRLSHHHGLVTSWRVADAEDVNPLGRARSFEIVDPSDHSLDVPFVNADAFALQYKGDSAEIGYEVPADPLRGDAYLDDYIDPPEALSDPVIWVAVNAYHDTRDEEIPTMSYHHVSFELHPRDFLGQNPGEDSYDSRGLPVDPPFEILG